MGEVAQNLTSITTIVVVNEMYGTYTNIPGLLGTLWLQQQVIFKPTPKSSLFSFTELVGDAITAPHIKRWLLRTLQRKPEVAYTILNVCEQAYLLASGQTRKRAQIILFAQGDYASVDASSYKQINKMGVQLVAKLDIAACGGETFTPCMMWEPYRARNNRVGRPTARASPVSASLERGSAQTHTPASLTKPKKSNFYGST